MEERCITGSFVNERKRASNREFSPNSQDIASRCGCLMLRAFPLGCQVTAATCPSCQLRQKQQSTISPTFTQGSTRRSASLTANASLLFSYSIASTPSNLLTETAFRILFSIREESGSSRVRGCRQMEQAALCLRDSSTHGRQKTCPHGVSTGSMINSRQIGQLNFQSATAESCCSSSKRIILPCLLLRPSNFCRKACLMTFLSKRVCLAMALVRRSGFSSAICSLSSYTTACP